ncbi:DEAD/DEAH box helicase family protein [candidate division WWE3 bacterium]|uniref:DEAD/DEAH box helicase family protein n=1 Tax=candidate division WWE3 bacterium TaxID=2053526 RepID=A0A955J1V5_UNCKA|nr:DEAD/DEAH box helicase family protein [candidate division WWE3 bacterium]
MDNTILIEKLKEKVTEWIKKDYEGAFKETKNILRHIKSVNFLYTPQIEALETYIYLKEILGNKPTSSLITSLFGSPKEFIDLLPISVDEKYNLAFDEKRDEKIQKLLEKEFGQFAYPNQVYALTMGSGKTILMGTMILYEFVLSTRKPEDARFAKNILVFAPDTTIIESLKEIKEFDYSKVIPKEYQNALLNIKYHYLESTDTAVNFLGNYNIVVSNSQKIIMKRRRTETKDQPFLLNETTRNNEYKINDRLRAIRRLENLSIFVDEAHHSYGSKGRDSLEKTLKSSRETIKHINEEGKTPLVNVVNLTGTPYVNNKMINDVVYHFGLKQGIEHGILKEVRFFEYENIKSEQFIEQVVSNFVENYGENRLEGKLPKIAIYASNIKDLQQDLRPALEKVLLNKGINTDKILEYHTEAEQYREEFLVLDTPQSNKQFILLVGKGTEGWNVRSLTATALYRKPSSSIFVLQSTTRCMRSIGDNSTVATIFLSPENAKILDNELENNFGVTRADLEQQNAEKIELKLKVQKKKTLNVIKQIREVLSIESKDIKGIKLSSLDKLREHISDIIVKTKEIVKENGNPEAKLTSTKEHSIQIETNKRTIYEIVTELSLTTHVGCLKIKEILLNNGLYVEELTDLVSKNDEIIEHLSNEIISQMFNYKESVQQVEETIELTKNFPFNITRDKKHQSLIVYKESTETNRLGFHIDPYAFDSKDELELFNFLQNELEPNEYVTDIYFTGNLNDTTHTDFYFEYWSPQKERVYNYYPDFLIETSKSRYIVIEVKSDKERTTYEANKKQYEQGKDELFDEVFSKELGFRDFQELNKNFEYHIIFDARLQQKQKALVEQLSLK